MRRLARLILIKIGPSPLEDPTPISQYYIGFSSWILSHLTVIFLGGSARRLRVHNPVANGPIVGRHVCAFTFGKLHAHFIC
jgi:hypothetical protein